MPKEAAATEPSHGEVRTELDRIAASELFVSAGRLAPFLRYVVEATIDGRSAELKESVLGVEVFGRSPGYDPRTDPIVRVEARRLRARLSDYYGGQGQSDPVIIDLPKGTYVPVFTSRACTLPPPPAPPALDRWKYVALTAMLAIAAVTWFVSRRLAPSATPSVAVLPFVNISADPANEYFTDGLTDELIDTLSRMKGLKVVGRSLVFQQKGKHSDVQALARQWNVGSVLEGSVRRSGDRLRITVQLTNAEDGYNVWSQTYDRELRDVFAIQQEIATAIARVLRVKLSAGPGALEPRQTNLKAYNYYLQARYQLNRYSDEGMRLAFQALDEAVAADPNYAPAQTLLAQVHGFAGYYYVEKPAEAWVKARRAAERALVLDPNSGEAHAAMGFVLGAAEWKWSEAEREFQRALELDPGSADVHSSYALGCLMAQGRLDEAAAEFASGIELDPLVVLPHVARAFALLAAKRYDEALREYEKALELNTTFGDIWWDKGMCHAYRGEREQATKCFLQAQKIEGDPETELGAGALALLGDKEAAAKRMAVWTATARLEGEEFMNAARIYAVIGDKPKALEWLQKAWEIRDPQLMWLKIDPRFESVRSEPEFQAMLRKMGL